MRDRGRIALALALGVLLLYTPALGRTLYLHYDEVYFAIQAHAIAATGHDTNGRFMPVYFEATSGSWFQPAVVYFTALFLTVLPLSETVLRLPTVFIAIFDVVLMYLIARKVFERQSWAIVTAVSLMLTPAHVIFGRLALSYLYPVFFLLAWLYCLILFLERGRTSTLLLGTTCLGFGFFTYIAAMAMMPLYLGMTLVVLWLRFDKPWKLSTVAVLGFAVPVLLTLPFHLKYPGMLFQKVGTYGPSAAGGGLDPLQQISELLNYTNLSYRVSLFSSFFDPGYLFLSGAANVANGTRQAGVFLLPLIVFIPVGIYQLLRHERSIINVVIVLGFVTAPLAATLVPESGATDRELEVLPFGVLLATFGIRYLWSAPFTARLRPLTTSMAAGGLLLAVAYAGVTLMRRGTLSRGTLLLTAASLVVYVIGSASDASRRWRPITAVLLLTGVLQFVYFYRDYLTEYPKRSAGWFMNNRRGLIEEVFKREAPGDLHKVFVSTNVQYADSYWNLYASILRRDDVRALMTYFDPEATHIADIPPGSLVVVPAAESARPDHAFAAQPDLVRLQTISDVDGLPTFLILQKRRPAN